MRVHDLFSGGITPEEASIIGLPRTLLDPQKIRDYLPITNAKGARLAYTVYNTTSSIVMSTPLGVNGLCKVYGSLTRR